MTKFFNIKNPGPHLPRRLREIEWVCRLGADEDDKKLTGLVSVHRLPEVGKIYDFGMKSCRCLDEVHLKNTGKYKQTRRTVREGDYYVQYTTGAWDVMDKQTLGWYRNKLKQQQEAEAKEETEVKDVPD